MESDPEALPLFLDSDGIAAVLPGDLMRTGTIYGLYDKRSPDRIRYVGRTIQPLDVRLSGHRSSPLPGVGPWMEKMYRRAVDEAKHADNPGVAHLLAKDAAAPLIKPLREEVPERELRRAENEEIAHHLHAGADLLNKEIPGEVSNLITRWILGGAGVGAQDLAYLRAHPSRHVLMLRLRRALTRHARRRERQEQAPEEREAALRRTLARYRGLGTGRAPAQDRGYVNAAGDRIGPNDFDPFAGCDPDEDPELWG